MRKDYIRRYLILSLYVLVIAVTCVGISFLNKAAFMTEDNNNYVTGILDDNTQTVLKEEVPNSVVKPFIGETKLEVSYYDMNEDAEKQEQSLLAYKNTYMPSTGHLYTSDTEFNIVSSMDGRIKSINNDEILGTVVEIEHENDLITYYYSLKDVTVSEKDEVKAGDIIGTSTSNGVTEKNSLLFEVYSNGTHINPDNFFTMNLEHAN